MVDWPAQRHAQMLWTSAVEVAAAVEYRGSPRTDEWLDLLRFNSYADLAKRKSKYLGGQLTWARVADGAVSAVAKAMVLHDVERALDAANDAHVLAKRLRERDAHPNARVTAVTRRRIGMVDALGTCLETVAQLRDGTLRPDNFDALGRLLALRSRWYALQREVPALEGAGHDWVVELVQGAAGKVLSSDAGPGAKAMATRAVSAWTPDVPPDAPRDAPPVLPAPPKRMRLDGDGGERVQWTDEDDLLF